MGRFDRTSLPKGHGAPKGQIRQQPKPRVDANGKPSAKAGK